MFMKKKPQIGRLTTECCLCPAVIGNDGTKKILLSALPVETGNASCSTMDDKLWQAKVQIEEDILQFHWVLNVQGQLVVEDKYSPENGLL